jgi:hypothetical protein
MMALRGVRSSWLMFARKPLLATLAASACRFASSSCCDWSRSSAIAERAIAMAPIVRSRSSFAFQPMTSRYTADMYTRNTLASSAGQGSGRRSANATQRSISR